MVIVYRLHAYLVVALVILYVCVYVFYFNIIVFVVVRLGFLADGSLHGR